MPAKHIHRILIIKPSSFGDIIHGLLIVQSLKEQRPDIQVDWVARDIFAGLLEHSPLVSKVFYFKRSHGFKAFINLLKDIRQNSYDIVWDMQGLLRSGIMTLAAKSPKKIGRSDAREGAQWFYNESIPLPNELKKIHAVDILLPFLKTIGLEVKISEAPLLFDFNNKEVNVNIGLKPSEYIVFFPDSRRPEKMWPYFRELTAYLIHQGLDYPILWVGQEKMESEIDWAKSGFKNLIGKTKIAQLIGIIGQARLVVANDSGPMHLAAALKRPVLGLFGPTESDCFGPYPLSGKLNHVLKASALEGDLRTLTVETVAQRIEKILSEIL